MKEILLIISLISIIAFGVYKAQSRKKTLPNEQNQPEIQEENAEGGEKTMGLQNKKIVMVIAPQDFRDQEYNEPRQILADQGAEITTASLNIGESTGADGTKVKIDQQIQDIKAENFDAIVFIGGPGMIGLTNNEDFKTKAQEFFEADKLTTAICIAPEILANAGILKGKKATVSEDAKNTLINNGAEYTGNDVEIDGKIITANGPSAAKKFGEKIVENIQ